MVSMKIAALLLSSSALVAALPASTYGKNSGNSQSGSTSSYKTNGGSSGTSSGTKSGYKSTASSSASSGTNSGSSSSYNTGSSSGTTSSTTSGTSSSSSAGTSSGSKSSGASSGTSYGTNASSGCTFSDASLVSKNKASCSSIVIKDMVVPAGVTLDLTGLKDGTTVTFQGTTSFGYKEWEGPLISTSGNSITITGASGHVIDACGTKWWDGKGSNGGKTKPKFFAAHSLKSSAIKGLNVKNTPVQAFSINSATNLVIDKVTIDSSAGDSGGGHNTDAFDVGSSSGVTISNCSVKNQDDCLAINSGSDITFANNVCSGGHGISIGSVGGRSDNDVTDVQVHSSQIINSDNGVRIKTIAGATGSVKNIVYKDITLTNIAKYGIVIEQDYQNGSPTGSPTTGVPITGLTISNVKGSVASKGVNAYILCGKGSCSGWSFNGVAVSGGQTSSKCMNVPSGATC